MSDSGSIFLVGKDGELTELRQEAYDAEELLQELLVRYPALLGGDQIRPEHPLRWLLVSREQGVPGEEAGGNRWSLDHLFLDQDAVPTLIEVKRSSDTRIRREVVGQMLDYAANAVAYWSLEELRSSFIQTCHENGQDPGQVLDEFVGTEGAEGFWQKVKTNLQAGRLRLIFVADEIPKELKRIIEFLNEQMDPAEVLGVEVPRFSGEGLQTLTPRVVGQTAHAEGRKSTGSRPTRQWDFDSFIQAIEERNGPEVKRVALRIIDWADQHLPRRWFGTGVRDASFTPTLDLDGKSYAPFALYTYGSIEIKFQYLAGWSPFDDRERRDALRKRLNEIEGVDIAEERLNGRPNFPASLLTNDESLEEFFAAMEWCLTSLTESVKANAGG